MARYGKEHNYKPGECRGGGRYWNASLAEERQKKMRCRVCGKLVRITTRVVDKQGFPILRIAYHTGD
jgi:hypothetical protein